MNPIFLFSASRGLFLFVLPLVFACSSPHEQNQQGDSTPVAVEKPQAQTPLIEAKTFEVRDSTNQLTGWGYDLYVDGKRSIHQPHIPAIAGNNPFKTQADAQRVGDLAALKMRAGMGLPTISLAELDSLNIKP